jgi:hypothetical protein
MKSRTRTTRTGTRGSRLWILHDPGSSTCSRCCLLKSGISITDGWMGSFINEKAAWCRNLPRGNDRRDRRRDYTATACWPQAEATTQRSHAPRSLDRGYAGKPLSRSARVSVAWTQAAQDAVDSRICLYRGEEMNRTLRGAAVCAVCGWETYIQAPEDNEGYYQPMQCTQCGTMEAVELRPQEGAIDG